MLRELDADSYVMSYPAWGLPESVGSIPLPVNFEEHPQRTEHVVIVAGDGAHTVQTELKVVKDDQNCIAELTGDGLGRYSQHGLFHGLLEAPHSTTIN